MALPQHTITGSGQSYSHSYPNVNGGALKMKELNLSISASQLLLGFVSKLLENKGKGTLQDLQTERVQYSKDVYCEWHGSHFGGLYNEQNPDHQEASHTAYSVFIEQLLAIETGLRLFWNLLPDPQFFGTPHHNDHFPRAEPMDMAEDFLPNIFLNECSNWDPALDPALVSSSDSFCMASTPAVALPSSPPLPYIQTSPYPSSHIPSYEGQMFPSSQLVQLQVNPAKKIKMSNINDCQCYKSSEDWFRQFINRWLSENRDSQVGDLVDFINKHQVHIEDVFTALQAVDDTTLDKNKPASIELRQINQIDFYTAAVEVAYEVEKRIRLGPVKRNKGGSLISDDFDERVQQVCKYFRSCKNSCVRLCKPRFITDVVDMPSKMFERFLTNTNGNAAKAQKRRTGKPDKPKKPAFSSVVRQTQAADTVSPSLRVSKRLANRVSSWRTADADDDGDDDDEFDEDTINVVQHIPTVNPAHLTNRRVTRARFQPY